MQLSCHRQQSPARYPQVRQREHISGSRSPSRFFVDLGAAMIVVSTVVPARRFWPLTRQVRVDPLEDPPRQAMRFQQATDTASPAPSRQGRSPGACACACPGSRHHRTSAASIIIPVRLRYCRRDRGSCSDPARRTTQARSQVLKLGGESDHDWRDRGQSNPRLLDDVRLKPGCTAQAA